MKDAVGTSWTGVAAEKEVDGKRMDDLLSEVRSRVRQMRRCGGSRWRRGGFHYPRVGQRGGGQGRGRDGDRDGARRKRRQYATGKLTQWAWSPRICLACPVQSHPIPPRSHASASAGTSSSRKIAPPSKPISTSWGLDKKAQRRLWSARGVRISIPWR